MTKSVKKADKNSGLMIAKPTQQDIPALLAKVDEQITKLKGDAPDKESTAGTSLGVFGQIKNISKVEDLVKAHSMLKAKARAYKESADELDININKFPFKQDGFTVEVWTGDIKSRLAIVKNETELNKLLEVKKLLEKNLSQEAQLQNDLIKAQKIMFDEE